MSAIINKGKDEENAIIRDSVFGLVSTFIKYKYDAKLLNKRYT